MNLHFSPLASRTALDEANASAQYTRVESKAKRLPDGSDFLKLSRMGQVPLLVTDTGEWLGFIGAELHKALFAPLLDRNAPDVVREYTRSQLVLRFEMPVQHRLGGAARHETLIARRHVVGRQIVVSALAICAMSVAGAAWGETALWGQATLMNAVATPSELVVEGVAWRCEADKCIGRAERRSTLNSFVRDCRKVAEAVGPLVSFKGRGRIATKGEIGACNRVAGKRQ